MPEERFTARSDEVSGTARSRPLPATDVHSLMAAIERLGVESGLVTLDTAPARGAGEVGQVDRTTLGRPAGQVLVGAAVGAGLAFGLGLIALVVWGLAPAPVILMSLFIGAILGGLWSLYGHLLANVDASDADTGGSSVVQVETATLDPAVARQVWNLVREANPSGASLAGPGTGR